MLIVLTFAEIHQGELRSRHHARRLREAQEFYDEHPELDPERNKRNPARERSLLGYVIELWWVMFGQKCPCGGRRFPEHADILKGYWRYKCNVCGNALITMRYH